MLAGYLKAVFERSGNWQNNADVLQINCFFDSDINTVGLPTITTKERERRVGQLDWRTTLELIEEHQ